MSTQVQSRNLSPYLLVLETEISADLRATIKPEDLREEVRKTLFKEVLRQAGVALQEMMNHVEYYSRHEADAPKTEAKLARHLSYVNEMLGLRSSQRIEASHQITEGASDALGAE
jgi:hypothetical protein